MKPPAPIPSLDARSRIGRKLLLAVGLPPLGLALGGLVWLGTATHAAVWGPALAFLALMAAALVAIHFFAVRSLLERPLARMVAALKRAEENAFLLRVPVETDDELGELAKSFNNALATITDLHAHRIDDAESMASMQRELALKAEVEAQHALADEANRRLQHRLRELTLLASLSRALSSTIRLEVLLGTVTEQLGRELGYETFALMLASEGGRAGAGELEVRSLVGVDPSVMGTRIAFGEGVAGLAAEDRRRVLVRDTRIDARFPSQSWTHGRQGSVLAVPLVAGDACVGVLDFFRPVVDGFPDDEMDFLESVAGQAAMAIANAGLHERTLKLSLTDALTGLHNRRSFFQRLGMELDRSERFAMPFAVAMIDVDHFRLLHERGGHRVSDAALRRVAELARSATRRVDTSARLGGEELAVLLPRADAAAALEVAEKLRSLVEATAFEGAEALPGGRLTVSVGVAAFPEHAQAVDLLADCADAALYAAKRRGRNAVVAYEPGMREEPSRRRDIRTTGAADAGRDLTTALA